MTMKLYAPVLLAMLAVSCSGKNEEKDKDSLRGNRDEQSKQEIVSQQVQQNKVDIAAAVDAAIKAEPKAPLISETGEIAAPAANRLPLDNASAAATEAEAVAAQPAANAEVELAGPEGPAPERISTGVSIVDLICKATFLGLDGLAAGGTTLPKASDVNACQARMIAEGKKLVAGLGALDIYIDVQKAADAEDTVVLDGDVWAKHLADPLFLSSDPGYKKLFNSYLGGIYGLANAYDVYVLSSAEASLSETVSAIDRLNAKVADGSISDTEQDNLSTLNLILPIKQRKVDTVNKQINALYQFGNYTIVTAQVSSLKAQIEAAAAPQ